MKLNGLDLNKLNVFSSVIENHGYKNASEKLGLTRSAISQAITALEAQLNQSLFHRSGTKLVPTDNAIRFYEEVRRYQGGLESALSHFHSQAHTTTGLLKIGAYLEFTKGKLMPALESFLTENPNAQVQFHFDSPSRLETLLEKNKIDLAISIYPHQSKKMETRKLFQEELCLVGRRDLISQNPSSSEFTQIPIIDYFPSHLLFKRWWLTHFRNPSPSMRTRVFAATAEMVLEMCERRLGVGVVPKYLLERSSDKLHIVAPTTKKLIDHLWLSRHKSKKLTVLEKVFLESLTKTLL